MEKWYVAKSICNGEDYEVWKILPTEEECKKYVASLSKNQQKEFFYFQKESY